MEFLRGEHSRKVIDSFIKVFNMTFLFIWFVSFLSWFQLYLFYCKPYYVQTENPCMISSELNRAYYSFFNLTFSPRLLNIINKEWSGTKSEISQISCRATYTNFSFYLTISKIIKIVKSHLFYFFQQKMYLLF